MVYAFGYVFGHLRALIRLPFVLLWLISCLLCVATIYPLVPRPLRSRMNRAWSRLLMRLIGVRVTVRGQPCLDGAVLWVANHVSWIDIYILAGVRGILFIAKSEIRKWPVLGWLVAKVGTVFLQRGQRNSLKLVTEQMAQCFGQGEALGLFAEGTTSSGLDVLPFHASLFDPAMRSYVSIQPVALRFFHQGQRSDLAAFIGEETLVHNLWTLLRTRGVAVEAVFLPLLTAGDYAQWSRAQVAQHLHQRVAQEVTRDVIRQAAREATMPDSHRPL